MTVDIFCLNMYYTHIFSKKLTIKILGAEEIVYQIIQSSLIYMHVLYLAANTHTQAHTENK